MSCRNRKKALKGFVCVLKGITPSEVRDNPAIEDVVTKIFELNYDNQAKELLEGQRRYIEQMATEYAAGVSDVKKEMQPVINDLEVKNVNSKSEHARLWVLLKEHGISDK